MIRVSVVGFLVLSVSLAVSCMPVLAEPPEKEPVAVTEKIVLFDGKDLSKFTTWLKGTGREDPRQVFTVADGTICVSGDGLGYLATRNAYKDYRLIVDFKWGKRDPASKYVRNSGVLLNAVGPDGGAGKGAWMTSIECQLAQGCEGDLIVIGGKDKEGNKIPATITSDTIQGSDGQVRWKKGGTVTKYSGKQFWWSKHDPLFKELIDTRGRDDVASPLGQWTRLECICNGNRITVKINGEIVNACYDVDPPAGKILLQSEGHAIFFRNVELHPLNSQIQDGGTTR